MKVFVLVWWLFIYGVQSLRNVQLIFPKCVEEGDNVTLFCQYDLEGERLYAVKWYRGNYEFYRYCPTDHPFEKKTFSIQGIEVDVDASSANRVTLLNVPRFIAGNFTCEVSLEEPTFFTGHVIKHLDIVPREVFSSNPDEAPPDNLIECDDFSSSQRLQSLGTLVLIIIITLCICI